MPYLDKNSISQYIRTKCKRQLRLNLSPDTDRFRAERNEQNMPIPQPPRPGLQAFREEGERWQAVKLNDLTQTFGDDFVIGNRRVTEEGNIVYENINLIEILPNCPSGVFLIESQYSISEGSNFEQALETETLRNNFNLEYARVRPDIIEILPPLFSLSCVLPSGDIIGLHPNDARKQLRVIDIKLTAEPSPSYFAEVAYYAMTLSGWLLDNNLDNEFVVIAECAVWSGSHEASNLLTSYREIVSEGGVPTFEQLRSAMAEDLEPVPFEVFAFRIRRFFQDELPIVLSTPWQELEWHVDNSCKNCENLGYPWVNREGQRTDREGHCIPTATQIDHLSRIAFISRGASNALQIQGVSQVNELAARNPRDNIFDTHQQLRVMRTIVPGRAVSLRDVNPHIPDRTGTSAVMPKWADLTIYLSVDYDVSSAISFALAVKGFWLEPFQARGQQRQNRSWDTQIFPIDLKDINIERRELLAFLNQINNILSQARDLNPNTTVQFYLWDTLQYDQLTKIIGRHLEAILQNHTLQHLAWLFPPEDLLQNPEMATRNSPLTIVKDIVKSLVAAPIPHYYSLLEVARVYHQENLPANIAQFSIHPLYEDILSDLIPSERAHEIWARNTTPRHWRQQMTILEETVSKRLNALETVTRRLQNDLQNSLTYVAPQINIRPPVRQNRLSFDGQLWYAYSKLDDALTQLEIQQIRAMPPHEREARFHSARLLRQLFEDEKQTVLNRLNIQDAPNRRVYLMRRNSSEVKLRENDFNFAIAPELEPRFLDFQYQSLTNGTALERFDNVRWLRMENLTSVNIIVIDRENCILVLDSNRRNPTILDDLEENDIANFSSNVILDPTHRDYFTNKLLSSLQAIGNPPIARINPLVQRAIGQPGRGARRTNHTPPADVLWDALTMSNTHVNRNLQPVRDYLENYGLSLNTSQWEAWEAALSSRLQLIWGPPGTGKSRTARAIIDGAIIDALREDKPLRILVSGSTYNAVDNVFLKVFEDMTNCLQPGEVQFNRIRSYLNQDVPEIAIPIDTELNKANPSIQINELRTRLLNNEGITIVSATSEQIHNLSTLNNNSSQAELFDLILIDEASQMDVAHSILVFCTLAQNGSIIIAGDPKQLPPIHKATPPDGLESMVGSVYSFFEDIHQVPSVMLNENYRSNSTIVEFTRSAGYRENLTSFSPELSMNLLEPIPTIEPQNWSEQLYWTEEWARIIDPNNPTVCFVYPEGISSQSNQFEADAVSTIIYLLYGRLGRQLLNERNPNSGEFIDQYINEPYSPEEFWQKAVGVVTPHRAQQGLIVNRLQNLFRDSGINPRRIRDAVDTVERFQGNQRDVMIASFALGDPDEISNEDEFLLSLNRFNVMASRARTKLIVLLTQEVVDHLSTDIDTLNNSRLIKIYANSFCNNASEMSLGHVENGQNIIVPGIYKFR